MTSIDKEGTGLNYDIELINSVVDQVSIPVIVHGGAGNIEHLIDVLNKTKVNALSIASMLHYSLVNKIKINEKFFDEGNLEFLRANKTFKSFENVTIEIIKSKLTEKKFNVRENEK